METGRIGPRRSLTMPGLSATVADQIAALKRVAGEKAVKLIRRERDPLVEQIVFGWPQTFDARRAQELGFRAETSFDEIIQTHIEDELEGRLP
jgi:nucleoside-diphosphate-sugar epimerase